MPYLHTALANTNAELQQACLFPSYQQLSLFAERHQNLDLSDALELFADRYTSFMRPFSIFCRELLHTVQLKAVARS